MPQFLKFTPELKNDVLGTEQGTMHGTMKLFFWKTTPPFASLSPCREKYSDDTDFDQTDMFNMYCS